MTKRSFSVSGRGSLNADITVGLAPPQEMASGSIGQVLSRWLRKGYQDDRKLTYEAWVAALLMGHEAQIFRAPDRCTNHMVSLLIVYDARRNGVYEPAGDVARVEHLCELLCTGEIAFIKEAP